MSIKFVSEDKIPARVGHGVRKYEDLYEALQKKPGKWAEITQAQKFTMSHRDNGKKTYPGVKTMKRGDRFFVCFEATTKKTKTKRTAKAAKVAGTSRRRANKKGKRS